MRLGIATMLWKRPQITNAFLRYWREVGDIRIAAVSPEDDSDFDLRGWRVVLGPNSPLSDKANAAVSMLRGVGAVMILGSDDFAPREYAQAAVEAIRGGADYVEPEVLYCTDGSVTRRIECSRVGTGMVLSKRLLDEMNWKPFPSGIDIGLDGRLRKRTGEFTALPFPIVDVKSAVNLWPMEKYSSNPEAELPEFMNGVL